MRGRLFLAIGLASALRVPPLRLSATSPSAGSSKALYAQIDTVLRRGQKKGSSPLAMNTARALGKRWMEMPPADLVEATLVSGGLLLDSYEEGLAILLEAEEGAGVNVSGKCYSALMRLAQSQERPEDVLRLMARTRAIGVETTDGQLLGASAPPRASRIGAPSHAFTLSSPREATLRQPRARARDDRFGPAGA